MIISRPDIPPMPISHMQLEGYRMRALRQARASTMGGQLTRRKGQSLEFREYLPYTLGDDIRHVDWLASARYGLEHDLLVRNFQAEEQRRLIISVDTRATMWFPEQLPKVRFAFWLAEAISILAVRSDDRVYLHDLFADDAVDVAQLNRKSSGLDIGASLSGIWSRADGMSSQPNLSVLERVVKPSSVWLIVTDAYFADPEFRDYEGEPVRRLARFINRAIQGMTWVLFVDLDSWPFEKALFDMAATYVDSPHSPESEEPYDINDGNLSKVDDVIEGFKRRFLNMSGIPLSDQSRWRWPEHQLGDEDFFAQRFGVDGLLLRLFERLP